MFSLFKFRVLKQIEFSEHTKLTMIRSCISPHNFAVLCLFTQHRVNCWENKNKKHIHAYYKYILSKV